MKIKKYQLRRLISEVMSTKEIKAKLDDLAGKGDEEMMQAASLADALPDPETLHLDSSYEYRRQMINKLVYERDDLIEELEQLTSLDPTYDEEEYELAQMIRDHEYPMGPQGYPQDRHHQEAREVIRNRAQQNEVPEIQAEIDELNNMIQRLIDALGMDPVTAHISSLSGSKFDYL